MLKSTKEQLLQTLYKQFPSCNSLPIESSGATKIVYGEGNPNSPVLFLGEAPGQKEDELGRPFVGRSGQLLTTTLQHCGINRKDVFITNVVKCRPPNNRTPTPLEIAVYKKLILLPELKIINPQLIVTLGSVAINALLDGTAQPIGKIRGKAFNFHGILIVPTYHPAYILRNPADLTKFRHDIQHALTLLNQQETRV